MGVRHTWRTKSPKIQFLFVFFSFVRHKNVMVGWSQALLVGHKHHWNRPKLIVIAQPFHALCWTNAVQWRVRYFNNAFGWSVQLSVFIRYRDGQDFPDVVTWANHASCTACWNKVCAAARIGDTHMTWKTISDFASPSHVAFGAYFDCFGVWHHNLILMTCFCTTSFIFHCRMAEANAMIHYTRHHTRLVRLSSTFLLGFAAQHL
jgi:hypothetical protein